MAKNLIRVLKCLMLFSCALLITLVFADNMTTYDINFDYIQHIMSIDDTHKHKNMLWRAVTNPLWHHICYIFIIVLEGIASALLWFGSYDLFRHNSKSWAQVALLFTLILYILFFFVIGSQWFASWQSTLWNAKTAAFPFIMLFAVTYLIINSHED